MNKTRPKQLSFRVNEEEYQQLQEKVFQSGKNQQEYILSCVLEKQIVNTDGIKELIPELKRIGNNLNQIAKRCNEGGVLPSEAEVREQGEELEASMAVIKAVSSKAGIGQAIDYVTKEEKTEEKLVSGLHCEAETAKEEMQATKELWEKTGEGHTSILSRATIRTRKSRRSRHTGTPLQLAENTPAWKGFEVLVATHKDKDHIHTHFIVNSVNFEDGHKLQWSSADLRELKERCNAQSQEQGLHVPEKGKTFEGAEREETVAWSKDTYQLLKQAEQGKVKAMCRTLPWQSWTVRK